MTESRRHRSNRRPTTLIVVVVAAAVLALLVFLIGMAVSDGGDEEVDPVDEPEIEVPVDRGIPGEGDDPDE